MNTVYKNVRIADRDIEFILCEIKALFLRGKILKELKQYQDDEEKGKIYRYLKKHWLSVFPYEYVSEYNLNNVLAKKDDETGLIYIEDDGIRLYMKRSY